MRPDQVIRRARSWVCTASPHRGHRPCEARFARRILVTLLLLAGAGIAPQSLKAGSITYNIENYPAVQAGSQLSGSITTDGHIGSLASANILSWTVTIDSTTFASTDPGASVTIIDNKLVASSTAITLASDIIPNVFELSVPTTPNPSILEYDYSPTLAYVGQINTGLKWDTIFAQPGPPLTIGVFASSSVPEPSSAVLAVFGVIGIAYGWSSHRRAQRRAAAK